MSANHKQIGGSHYSQYGALQHWDVVYKFGLDYFQGCISKYLFRWKDKNGLEDLYKAKHYLEKYIELMKQEANGRGEDALQGKTFLTVKNQVKPNGWVGYTYEGGTKDKEEYTCKSCRTTFTSPVGRNPNDFHECGTSPDRHYIDQG